MNDEMNDDAAMRGAIERRRPRRHRRQARGRSRSYKRPRAATGLGWSAVVRGWRGLRDLAFKRAGAATPRPKPIAPR